MVARSSTWATSDPLLLESRMKNKEDLEKKLNELIAYADPRTEEDEAKLGAMLISAGSAFMHHASPGNARGAIDYCVEQGIRAANGESPLPVPRGENQS